MKRTLSLIEIDVARYDDNFVSLEIRKDETKENEGKRRKNTSFRTFKSMTSIFLSFVRGSFNFQYRWISTFEPFGKNL